MRLSHLPEDWGRRPLSRWEAANYAGLMLLAGTNSTILSVLLPYLHNGGIVSFAQAGTLQSLSTLVLAVTTLLIGFVIDRMKRGQVYGISLVLLLAGYLCYGGFAHVAAVGIAVVLVALGNTVMQNAYNIDLNHRIANDPKVVSLMTAFFPVAAVFTPALLSLCVRTTGRWSGYMLAMAVTTGLLFLLNRRANPAGEQAARSTGGTEKSRRVDVAGCVLNVALNTTSGLTQGLFTAWLVFFLIYTGAASMELAQLALSFLWVGNLLSRLLWPVLMLRIHYRTVFFGAAVCTTVCCGLIFAASGIWILPLAGIVGFGTGGFYPVLVADLGRSCGGRASVFCICTFIASVISMGGNLVMGWLFEHVGPGKGFLAVPAAGALLMLVCAVNIRYKGRVSGVS